MPLQSLWFRGNARLQQTLVSDPQHVKLGDRGEHVRLIQEALALLDGAGIEQRERIAWSYGPSTARAVKTYKTARKIINHAYQTAADDIVGRMTIAALDKAMGDEERRRIHLLLAAGFPAGATAKNVVISETGSPWLQWAQQFAKGDANTRSMATMPAGASPAAAAGAIQAAISQASGGALVLSVGHGWGGGSFWSNEGILDLAPGGTFRIGGANALLPGDPPPRGAKNPKYVTTSAFYDFRFHKEDITRKEWDESHPNNPAARTRLGNWKAYEDVCKAFQQGSTRGVAILTCRVGQSVDFLKRIAEQWNVLLLAYRRKVVGQMVDGRARLFLQGDGPGHGTNDALGEVFLPCGDTTADLAFIWQGGSFP